MRHGLQSGKFTFCETGMSGGRCNTSCPFIKLENDHGYGPQQKKHGKCSQAGDTGMDVAIDVVTFVHAHTHAQRYRIIKYTTCIYK